MPSKQVRDSLAKANRIRMDQARFRSEVKGYSRVEQIGLMADLLDASEEKLDNGRKAVYRIRLWPFLRLMRGRKGQRGGPDDQVVRFLTDAYVDPSKWHNRLNELDPRDRERLSRVLRWEEQEYDDNE